MSDNRPRLAPTAWAVEGGQLSPRSLEEITAVLQDGGMILLPTESSYALAADSRRHDALCAVRAFKGREEGGKPLLLLCASVEQAREVARFDAHAEKLAALWPAPLTLVLPPRNHFLATALGAPDVAVRVPDHPVARQVCQALGAAVSGTSANRSGEPPALDRGGALALLEQAGASRLRGLVDAGTLPGGPPSTLLDLTGPRPEILRPGAFPQDRLEAVLGLTLD
jgi:L-threonylcarbamoyladenylate synthase